MALEASVLRIERKITAEIAKNLLSNFKYEEFELQEKFISPEYDRKA